VILDLVHPETDIKVHSKSILGRIVPLPRMYTIALRNSSLNTTLTNPLLKPTPEELHLPPLIHHTGSLPMIGKGSMSGGRNQFVLLPKNIKNDLIVHPEPNHRMVICYAEARSCGVDM
jgi:hypothetical protein